MRYLAGFIIVMACCSGIAMADECTFLAAGSGEKMVDTGVAAIKELVSLGGNKR